MNWEQQERLYKQIDKLEEDFKNWETRLRDNLFKKGEDLENWFRNLSDQELNNNKNQDRHIAGLDAIAKEWERTEETIRKRREAVDKQIEGIHRKTGGFLE